MGRDGIRQSQSPTDTGQTPHRLAQLVDELRALADASPEGDAEALVQALGYGRRKDCSHGGQARRAQACGRVESQQRQERRACDRMRIDPGKRRCPTSLPESAERAVQRDAAIPSCTEPGGGSPTGGRNRRENCCLRSDTGSICCRSSVAIVLPKLRRPSASTRERGCRRVLWH